MTEKIQYIPARQKNAAVGGHVAGAEDIIDDALGKEQNQINQETILALNDRYTKSQTYNKTELDSMITTPNQKYVNLSAEDGDTLADIFDGVTGAADTIYRVGSWDGEQYDATVYSEYAFDGTNFVYLNTKTQVGEVFDISLAHASGGELAKYADLEAALGTDGANVPEGIRKGGMSVKFVQSSDNKYMQYRLMTQDFSISESDWQGVDDEPIPGSGNLVTSGGVAKISRYDFDMDSAPVGSMNNSGVVNSSNTNFNTTDFIPVKKDNVFFYKGFTQACAICGFDANKSNPTVLLSGSAYNQETSVTIPANIAYIRVSSANSNHSSYNGRYLYKCDFINFGQFYSGEYLNLVSIINNLRHSNDLISAEGISKNLAFEIPFDNGHQRLNSDGTLTTTISAQYDITKYIKVKPGSLVHYRGYMASSMGCLAGYDGNKENPIMLIMGSSSTQDLYIQIPASGVSYILACGANDNYTGYNGRTLELFDVDSLKTILQDNIDRNTNTIEENKIQYGGEYITFDVVGQLKIDGTIATNQSTFNTSEMLPVNVGDLIMYKGYTGGSTYYAPIVGYDKNKENPTVLHETQSNVPFEVIIPSGISYIRVSAANSNHSSYQGRYCKIVPKYYAYKTEEIDKQIKDIEDNISDLFYLDKTVLETVKPNGATWSSIADAHTGAGEYYVECEIAPTEIKLYTGYGGTTTLVRTLTGNDIVTVEPGIYKFLITQNDMDSDAAWIRFNINLYGSTTFFECYTFKRVSRIESPLNGKKLAVIGDSISTIYGKNTPYFKIQDIDVGHEIQSYVSYIDVYGSVPPSEQPEPLGTTIGGTELTDAMIGTLQTFTPLAEDVGKELGTAMNNNGRNVRVWSEVLCERTGAILLANASYSGSSMCSGQGKLYSMSHAFSPMTIGRCHVRDDEGNYIDPDVIVIYRGCNDFSHKQGGINGLYSTLDNYDLAANGYPITDEYEDNGITCYSYRRAYYATIKALRDAYPNAIIYCTTLNVFKRIVYDRFPTRNGQYSLPEMNNVIRDIANQTGCGIIEFDKDGITFENCYSQGYITDSAETPTHPNSKGHEVMARKAIEDLKQVL